MSNMIFNLSKIIFIGNFFQCFVQIQQTHFNLDLEYCIHLQTNWTQTHPPLLRHLQLSSLCKKILNSLIMQQRKGSILWDSSYFANATTTTTPPPQKKLKNNSTKQKVYGQKCSALSEMTPGHLQTKQLVSNECVLHIHVQLTCTSRNNLNMYIWLTDRNLNHFKDTCIPQLP